MRTVRVVPRRRVLVAPRSYSRLMTAGIGWAAHIEVAALDEPVLDDAIGPIVGCLTRDTLSPMAQVSVRDLRNHGGDVLDRVEAGEHITVTRNGKPVAELVPLARPRLTTAEIIERRKHLPDIDPDKLRADIGALFDTRIFPDDE